MSESPLLRIMLTLALPSNWPCLSKTLEVFLRIRFSSWCSIGMNILDKVSICYYYTSSFPSFCLKILFILFIMLVTRSFFHNTTSSYTFWVNRLFYMSSSLLSVSLNIFLLTNSFSNLLRSIKLITISLFS